MYRIMCRVSYTEGTLNAPTDAPMMDEYGEVMEYESRDDAHQWLRDNGYRELGSIEDLGSTETDMWVSPGIYRLEHGEWARPYYEVVRR